MYPSNILDILGIFTGAGLMLIIYSYPLYKENRVYRIAEHIYIGVALAVTLLVAIGNADRLAFTPLRNGNLIYVVPLLLGAMMYTILWKPMKWVSKFPVAILVGSAIGIGARGVLSTNLLSQAISTITPPATDTLLNWWNFAYIGIGTACTITYFLLTTEHKGVIAVPSRIGRLLIMVGLGTYFGNTVLGRMTMLSGRAQYLLQVLKLIPM